MELLICLTLAVSVFSLIIVCLVGLVSAPTPVLLAIFVAGMMLTQKSIDKFTEAEVGFTEEKDKTKVEKVDLSYSSPEEKNPVNYLKSMVYRGSNYHRNFNLEKPSPSKSRIAIRYRGVKIPSESSNNQDVV